MPREVHEVSIKLGASYPRMMPELQWKSPIFHPNISAGGVVCLGGYGTHWVPSLNLDELCVMLWDMIRYANYDVESPYNREAALWARTQAEYRFPVDHRPLRDKLAKNKMANDLLPLATPVAKPKAKSSRGSSPDRSPQPPVRPASPAPPRPAATSGDVLFIDGSEPLEAQIVPPSRRPSGDGDVLFIE